MTCRKKKEGRVFLHISVTKMDHLTVSEPIGRKMEGLTVQVDGSLRKPIWYKVCGGEFTQLDAGKVEAPDSLEHNLYITAPVSVPMKTSHRLLCVSSGSCWRGQCVLLRIENFENKLRSLLFEVNIFKYKQACIMTNIKHGLSLKEGF